MQDHERKLLTLLGIGAVIGLAKLLVSEEPLTTRLIAGRALLGSATTTIAGVALIQVPDLNPLALCGIGSALGIIGAQYIELWLKRKAGRFNRSNDRSEL